MNYSDLSICSSSCKYLVTLNMVLLSKNLLIIKEFIEELGDSPPNPRLGGRLRPPNPLQNVIVMSSEEWM